jgi:hypothetical protein
VEPFIGLTLFEALDVAQAKERDGHPVVLGRVTVYGSAAQGMKRDSEDR